MKKILLLLPVVLIAACQSSTTPTAAELRAIVDKQNEKLEEAFKEGNVEKLSEMYDVNAKLCGNGEKEIYVGRDAIRKFWAGAMEGTKLIEMKTETVTVDGDGNLIYETGKVSNKVLYKDSIYSSTAKFVNVWKKQTDGSYKLDIDTWNSIKD